MGRNHNHSIKMKLFYMVVASALARKNQEDTFRKKSYVPLKEGDYPEAFKVWWDEKSGFNKPAQAMQDMYNNEMVNYGKNDWAVFANGIKKWGEKLDTAFQKKLAKCGDNYWMDPMKPDKKPKDKEDRRRRDVDQSERGNGENKATKCSKKEKKANGGKCPEKTTAAPATTAGGDDNNGTGGEMNEWCNRFNGHVNQLVAWTEAHMVECCFIQKKKNNQTKKCTKGGDKFVKKWKKVMGKFQQGAHNQEAGPQCTKEWKPTF